MHDKVQKQAIAIAEWASFSTSIYLPELLVNVYSYCLMVKVCLAVMCVEANVSQIQSHL